METRANFGKIGVILATAGSAVGLGNIWRFPFMAGQNGGAAFIVIYIVCVFLLGIPGMIAEFIVGRHGASNAADAYTSFGKGKAWGFVGILGVITSTIILGFYAVVAGWCMQYLFVSIFGGINGDTTAVKDYFSTFSSDPVKPTLWAVAFVLMTHFVITQGVRKGIEKASNILMPTLFVLLIIIVIASCTLPNAGKGIKFLFHPDFSKLTHDVFLDALGQAFFSLSLGTACLCTYASYFSRQTNLYKSAAQIAFLDTGIAILAGLMIFPAAFSVGVNPDSGPSLIFITLPNVFQEAFGGIPVVEYLVALSFYILLSLAALTSLISIHEVSTAFVEEEFNVSRNRSATIVTAVSMVIAVLCSLSLSDLDIICLGGKSLFDWLDSITSQILLPLGGFFTCLFLGWYVPKKIVKDQYTNWGTMPGKYFGVYMFCMKFLCPICILLVFLHQFGVI